MASAVYYVGQDSPPLEVYWREEGALLDFSDPSWGFVVSVGTKGAVPTFTKLTGIAGATGINSGPSATPNVQVVWTNELNQLVPGRYVFQLSATFPGLAPNLFFGDLIMRIAGPANGYCEIQDLLYNGDTQINMDEQLWVNMAADEMNARLGQFYDVPIDAGAPGVPVWVGLELKKINVLIATGRLQQSLANGDRATLQYGAGLIKEGQMCLEALMGQSLDGVTKSNGTFRVTAPGSSNPDVDSGVAAFEDFAMRNRPVRWWHPGDDKVIRRVW